MDIPLHLTTKAKNCSEKSILVKQINDSISNLIKSLKLYMYKTYLTLLYDFIGHTMANKYFKKMKTFPTFFLPDFV